jgi:hypothetical protein
MFIEAFGKENLVDRMQKKQTVFILYSKRQIPLSSFINIIFNFSCCARQKYILVAKLKAEKF